MDINSRHMYTGWKLVRNQFFAMMMKKYLSQIQSWLLYFIQSVLPAFFCIIDHRHYRREDFARPRKFPVLVNVTERNESNFWGALVTNSNLTFAVLPEANYIGLNGIA